ncbi:MAG: hypothetical protein IJ327_03305, partial [Lachnospiraceae bacterium]|nr:hypothetical protein [Lachnospiraceae bacterium]
EKLSSGYKINRAADDAAGLSISEKMRKQIRGLTQASLNAEDGISAVQTAEGALNEVQDMLQRMNELAVKAANGTNSEDDRSYIQNEIDQLVTEIDRVATTTKFNESYLLKGTNSDGTPAKLSYTTAATGLGISSENFDEDGVATMAMTAVASAAVTLQASQASVASTSSSPSKASVAAVTAEREAGYTVTIDSVTYHLYEGATDEELKKDATANVSDGFLGDDDANKVFSNKDDFMNAIKAATGEDVKEVTMEGENLEFTAFSDVNGNLNFSLHVGADATQDNKIGVDIQMMSARGLKINGLRVDGPDDTNATAAINVIADAIQQVSTQRSALGAVQNRLEHTINNLDNVVENTTAAESQIRDTDMATEMVRYSNNNILAQAGQSMLAQANQSNQGVMSLLQ